MKWASIVLLLGVFIANDGANWLAGPYSAAANFYMLQGVWVAILSAFAVAIFLEARRSIWRSLGVAAMTISIIEALEIPGCRLFVADISKVHGNICDAVTGLPISAVTVCIEVFIVAWIVGSELRE